MHSRYNSVLKVPKEEEQEVPDDGSVTHELSNVVVSGGSRDEFAHVDGTDFADELEGILGIPDDDGDDEALSKDKYCSGAQLMSWELDFMDWDQEFSPEEFKNINLENRSVAKRESSCCTTVGFWDEYVDDEQKVCLNLNLNYQQVLDAWSDRGPLWANHSLSTPTNGCYMGEVPVMEEEKNTRREASVLRYKEKRQTRLFSKKIRYQVRKLNADSRPRQKGRFVKRVNS